MIERPSGLAGDMARIVSAMTRPHPLPGRLPRFAAPQPSAGRLNLRESVFCEVRLVVFVVVASTVIAAPEDLLAVAIILAA